jgi:hypothetical protein
MSKTAKWILGIGIGVISLILIVALGYLVFSWWGGSGWMMETRGFRAWGD